MILPVIPKPARRIIRVLLLITALFHALPARAGDTLRFAVIGDYGSAGKDLRAVAAMINSWGVDLIITTGDNNYPDGEAATIDENVGQYFHGYIAPYQGTYGSGADSNRFFPTPGNHDWRARNAQPYLDYFTLPGNERYYDFRRGAVHFFAIDSDGNEPDGNSATSVQAQWLKSRLQASDAPWKVVYMHHAPYSSSRHGSVSTLQWPFAEWGASVVLAGHDHSYERLTVDSLLYIVNGLGGRSIYDFGTPLAASDFRYNGDYGAMLVRATRDSMVLEFYRKDGTRIDRHALGKKVTALNAIAGTREMPDTLGYLPNFPNPFNGSTNIRFRLRTRSAGTPIVRVYNILGRKVYERRFSPIPDGFFFSGEMRFLWDAGALPSGVYLYSVQYGANIIRGRMLLIR